MVEINEPLLMLNFVGLYILIMVSLVYNFYQTKRIYSLVETVGIVVAEMGEMKTGIGGIKEETNKVKEDLDEARKELLNDTYYRKEGTVQKLLREGMEMEKREE